MFLLSGLGKIVEPASAVKFMSFVVGENNFISDNSSLYIVLISIIEIIIAVMLAVRGDVIWVKLYIGMVSFFTVFLLFIYFTKENIPSCGCFGWFLPDGSAEIPILRNTVLILIGVYSLYISKSAQKT